ncbi:hypothetical protein NE865_09595 [Phthorimaea operculella]|nr:hypothetical protein NE865_09595 [Phthorimaea operculella]
MVIKSLITELNANNFYTIGYADDLAILLTGKFTSTVYDLTQAALRIVECCCTRYALSVNPTKTETVILTLQRVLGKYYLP